MTKPIKPSDPIIGPPRGDVETAFAWAVGAGAKRLDQLQAYLSEVYRLAPLVGIDPAIVVAQGSVETGNWGDIDGKGADAWVARLNPGSIGITSTGKPGEKDIDHGHAWKDGTDAARGQIVHLMMYAAQPPDAFVPAFNTTLATYGHLDPRRDAVIRSGYLGTVRLLSDLGNGRWAADPGYARKIADRGNQIFGFTEENPVADIVFGRVPKPKIIQMIVEKPYDGAGFTRVAPRKIVGMCTHITDGDPDGKPALGLYDLEWYHDFFATGGERQFDALTDYGIAQDGQIAMWNDPFGTRMPWASGGSDGLEGDGPLFVRMMGVQGINGGLGSKENVGRAPAKLTDAQLEANAALDAWHFDQARVPWNRYPFNPNVGCVTDMEHWEFATKGCPGAGVRGQTDARQNRTRAIMKKWQEGESQETVPPPKPVEPDHGRLPNGWTEAMIAEAFGVGTLVRPGKKDGRFKFHLGRAWAEAYVERAGREKVLPAVTVWQQVETDRDSAVDLISFVNGWLLMRFTDRGGWRWL